MQSDRCVALSWTFPAFCFAFAIVACGNVIGIPDYTYVDQDGGTSGSSSGVTSGSGGGSSGSQGGVTGSASGNSGTSSGSSGTFSGSGATGSTSGVSGATSGSVAGTSSGTASGTTGATGSASGATSGTTADASSGTSTGTSSGTTSGTSTGTSSGTTSGTSTGPAPTCDFGTPYNGSGSFTYYYFGQGSYMPSTGVYQTACGYTGTESGMTDTVPNIANSGLASNTYFAAIPGKNNFDTVNNCGACVEVTNGGNKVIATIIDECPTDMGMNPACTSASHLDLSKSAFDKLGYGVGNPSGTTWKFVACPVTGNIIAVAKNGNGNQVYLENTVFPIVSVSVNGSMATHLSYGAWSLSGNAGGATVTLTDAENHTVTATIPSGFGDLGVQFPSPGTCP